MKRLRSILLQLSVICSCICIIAKILDWYNPYMDFSGHVWFAQVLLYGSVIVSALLVQTKTRKNGKKKRLEEKNFSFCLEKHLLFV